MPDDLQISSLRGGLNNTDPPHLIQDDQCVIADNVEFFYSTLGERRRGCEPLTIAGSGLDDEAVVSYLTQWFPTNDVFHPEFWALGVTAGVSTTLSKRSPLGVWLEITPDDAIDTTAPDVYGVNAQALDSKLFFSYRSAVDRLHVWDGTTLRPTGLERPSSSPTAVAEGSGSTYLDTRYFRIRIIQKSGPTVLLRSEPSDVTTYVPTGTEAGALITRQALPGEGETHWELEASTNAADYYRIATLAVATMTYTDETDVTTEGYAQDGPLSEDIGTYDLIPSVKYISVDSDRLVMAGHWTDKDQKSRVSWTPVANDPGAGNDERLPLLTDNTVDLDTTESGEITGLSDSSNGTWYAFKWNHIYKFTRTGSVLRAYAVTTVSKSHGAIPGSIVSGVDENGRSCIYFLDPFVGPSRLGTFGLQSIRGLRRTWLRVNTTASVAARGVYYPDKQQVHWWVAADGNDSPSLKLVLQVSEISATASGAFRGWSLANGRIAEAYSAAIFNELTMNAEGDLTLLGRPFIGLTDPDFIQRCDIQDTDAGVGFVARIRTKPFFLTGLLNRWGAMTAALLATANNDATVRVALIRDFGVDTQEITTGLAPVGSEEYVIKPFDDLSLSESRGIQIEFSDVEGP